VCRLRMEPQAAGRCWPAQGICRREKGEISYTYT
jgi:hypothetical protein